MKQLLAIVLSSLFASLAFAVPGASPVALCRYTQPEYSLEEIAAVEKYVACVRDGAGKEREAAREKCYQVSIRPEFDKQVQCGDAPEWKICNLKNEAEECSAADRRNLPGRFTCEDLVNRYPEIGPLIDACREMANAEARDTTTNAETKARCAKSDIEGYELTKKKCRKTILVVPP